MIKKAHDVKVIKVPESIITFPQPLLEAALNRLQNVEKLAKKIDGLVLNEEECSQKKYNLSSKSIKILDHLKEVTNHNLRDIFCYAIFSYKEIFEGDLSIYFEK